jgi:uncharacterized protein (DUF305 family)
MRRLTIAALSALILSAVGVTACGSDSDEISSAATTTVAVGTDRTGSGTFNDADVTFAQSMIPHHEQAVEMAELALDPRASASEEIKELAKGVQAAQDPEIAQMKQWLTAWDKPMEMDTTGGHDMSAMDGMMSADDMAALGRATGEPFDTMWLEMMIRHHQGAIAMAITVRSSGADPQVKSLADAIIAGQQSEIDQMQALLTK